VEQGNVDQPTGTLYGRHQAFTLQATGQLQKAADYRPLIVAYRNGHPVRLQELGRVIDSVQNDKVASWYKHRAPSCWPFNATRANTVAVVDNITRLLPQFRNQIPAPCILTFFSTARSPFVIRSRMSSTHSSSPSAS